MQKTPEELRSDFWQEDSRNGSVIRKQYDTIKRVMNEHDFSWVEDRLNAIKQHVIDNTEFYKNYYISDAFPVMDKLLLKEHREACTAKGGFSEPIHVASTSGSTGIPFSVIQDFDKRKRTIADLKVFGELCDYPSHERMVYFRIMNPLRVRTAELEDRENIYIVNTSDLSYPRLEEMHRVIIDKKPRIIFSYASTMVELGKYLLSVHADPHEMGLTTVLCSGEGILEQDRQMLERAFDCKVYRRYATMEMGILGQDNGDGGAYRLNWGSYYFEILKIDSDEPAPEGEVGRIVITDLFNFAFPMIRYDTGDLGILERPGDGQLPLISELMGRHQDCIYNVQGTLISFAKIGLIMWAVPEVRQWQLIQENETSYTLKLNCDPSLDAGEIASLLREELGRTANVRVVFVDEIPVTGSNKRRATLCKLGKARLSEKGLFTHEHSSSS